MNARDKDGRPLADEHVLGSLRLLLIAGIDTTWSAIGSSRWHPAEHRRTASASIKEPELMPLAVEELLRADSPVTMAREGIRETTISSWWSEARQHGAVVVPGRDPRTPPCSPMPRRW